MTERTVCGACGYLTAAPSVQPADVEWLYDGRAMRPGEAAKALGVTTETVLAWAHRGWIRHTLNGYRPAYSSDDVDALIELCRGYGTPNAHLIKALRAETP